jgi:hypothetical protein
MKFIINFSLLSETDSEYDGFYMAESWDSANVYVALELWVELFINEGDKIAAEKWIVALIFDFTIWYQPPLKLLMYQTSKSTESHVWLCGCKSFTNLNETISETFRRFSDFHSHAWNILITEKSSSIELSSVPENLRVEISELQTTQVCLVISAKKPQLPSMPLHKMDCLISLELAHNLPSVSGSTCTCELPLSQTYNT